MTTITEEFSGVRVRAAVLTRILLMIGVWGYASASDNVQAEFSLPDKNAVRAVVEGIIAADNIEDLERVLGYYARDAILISPEGADVVGTDAIRKHYQALFSAVDFTIQSRIDDIAIAANLAVVRGSNKVSTVDADSHEKSCATSKYLMTLRHIDDEWKITQLMWSNQSIQCREWVFDRM